MVCFNRLVARAAQVRPIARVALRLWLGAALSAGAGFGAPVRGQDIVPSTVTQQAAISTQLAQELATAVKPVSFLVVLKDQVDARAAVASDGLQAATATERRSALYTI